MEILGGNFLRAIAEVVDILLSVYIWLIVGRAILSWVNPDPYNPIVRFLYSATEPVLGFARRYIPPIGGLNRPKSHSGSASDSFHKARRC